VEHVWQIEIGNELPAAGQQAAILATWYRAPDEPGRFQISHS
jgi:hypothetical protein